MGYYRDLIFYQKAREVVKSINDLIKAWPKTMQAQEISRLGLILLKAMAGMKAQSTFIISSLGKARRMKQITGFTPLSILA